MSVRLFEVLFLMCVLTFPNVHAELLGTFENASIHPGYLDFARTSPVFRGNTTEINSHGVAEARTPSAILYSFLDRNLQFDESKANAFIEAGESIRKNAFLSFCAEKLPSEVSLDRRYCKDLDPKNIAPDASKPLLKLFKKWKGEPVNVVSDLAIRKMQEAKNLSKNIDFKKINTEEAVPFVEAFFTAIEAMEGAKSEDAQWGRTTSKAKYYRDLVISLAETHTIESGRVEASNIPTPKELENKYPGQVYLSPTQLEELQSQGTDISLFNPKDSGFWRKPKESPAHYDPISYNHQVDENFKGKLTDQELKDLLDPNKEISVTILPISSSRGETPKIKVLYGKDQKWKLKFLTDKQNTPSTTNASTTVQKLLISSEVNIEPAVNHLAAAIGFTVDPTYYKKNVRLYLPEDVYKNGAFEKYLEEEVLKKIVGNFKSTWNLRSGFSKIETDDQGKKYIRFKGVTLEKRSDSDEDLKISSFVRHGLGKSFKREFRAFSLFLALIMDPDTKDDNVNLKVSKSGKSDYKMVFSSSDMGIALGFGFPNNYSKNLVHSVSHHSSGKIKEIKLNYRYFFKMPVMDAMSIPDARWITRLIAQIPKNKVVEIFRYSGFPEVVAQYYTETFLRRVDQLNDALGLVGTTFKGLDGQDVTITKKSKMVDPDHFSVPGYERFFKDGLLEDSNNELFNPKEELFPRDWGTDFFGETKGRHHEELYKLFTKGMVLEAGNFMQKIFINKFQIANNMGNNPFCKMNCFFNGTKIGIDFFVPMRFLIENPTSTASEYPYWIVDMFRLAVALGHGSGGVFQSLGLQVSEAALGLGGEFIHGFDFFKIRPVKDYSTALSAMKINPGAAPKFLMRNVTKSIVDQMQEGDVLISASYIGLRASLLLQADQINAPATVGIETGGEAYVTNRTYLLKGHDNQLLANWSDVKSINVFTGVFLRLIFFRVPILKAQFDASSSNNRVFAFDWKKSDAQNVLLENINKTNPTDVPEPFRYQSKNESYRGQQLKLNLFSLRNLDKKKGRLEMEGQDFLSGKKYHELAYQNSKSYRVFKDLEFFEQEKTEARAQVNSDGDLFARVKFRYFENQIYRQDFLNIYQDFSSIFPDDFIVFDPRSVKEFLGEFEINSMLILGPEALEKLFDKDGPSQKEVCLAYAEANGFLMKERWCQTVMGWKIVDQKKVHGRNFLKRFEAAKKLYFKPEAAHFVKSEDRNKIFHMLEALVDLFFLNKKDRKVVETLQRIIPRELFYRDVEMSSFLDGFPNQVGLIRSSDRSKGGLKPIPRYLLDSPDDVFKIFTDDIDQVLGKEGLLQRTSVF